MKYLEYIGIIFWTIIRKAIGVPVTMMVIPFRAYARNVVYNYVLQNKLYLQRLLERPIGEAWESDIEEPNYYLILPYHNTMGGHINYRKISWIEYKLVYWFIWGWLDDDSNYDTFDKGYNQSIIAGDRLPFNTPFFLE